MSDGILVKLADALAVNRELDANEHPHDCLPQGPGG
jgi:hypothetical protein